MTILDTKNLLKNMINVRPNATITGDLEGNPNPLNAGPSEEYSNDSINLDLPPITTPPQGLDAGNWGGLIHGEIPELPSSSEEETTYTAPIPNSSTAVSNYNYYLREYEEALLYSQLSELSMLDAYGSKIIAADDDVNSVLKNSRPNFEVQGSRFEENEAMKEYFAKYAISDTLETDGFENVILPTSQVQKSNFYSAAAKDEFPFHISFDFGMTTSGKFCEILNNKKYANFMVRALSETFSTGDVYERKSYTRTLQDGQTRRTRNKTWNFLGLMNYASGDQSNTVVLGSESDRNNCYGGNPERPVISYQNTVNEIGLIATIQGEISRLYDMLYIAYNPGQLRYSEVVCYRIAKYTKDDFNKPIQNFFFFNHPDVENFFFTDTQVKPGKDYLYKVFEYNIVMKENVQISVGGANIATRIPDVVLVENLIHTTDAMVLSKPPLYPETSFNSFLEDERKIGINFGKAYESKHEEPISFSSEEAARNQRHLSSQGSEDGKIQFANFGVSNSMNRRQIIEEDPVKVFEVFRTTQPPEEPLSFVGNLHRRVLDKNIIDRVQPDATYYYMFRSIDNHGNVSNPSPPFEVTLVGGVSPYLIINEFSYTGEEKKLETKTKGFKKFLLLRPAMEQLTTDRSRMDPETVSSLDVNSSNPVLLGKKTPPIWGKKFKMRVTSKKTGKKIDFNLEYDYKFEFRDD